MRRTRYWGMFDADKPQELWSFWETVFRFLGWFTYPLFMGFGLFVGGICIMKSVLNHGKMWVFVLGNILWILGIVICCVYFHVEQK